MDSSTTSLTAAGWRLGYPSGVGSVSASAGSYSDRIEISWDDSGTSDVYNKTESYDILRSTTNDFSSFSSYEKITTEVTSSPYMDLGTTGTPLNPNERYYYILVSKNEATAYITADLYDQSRVWSQPAIGYVSGFARGPVNYVGADEE